MVNKGDHPGQSSVKFLPMIEMNPSDPTCIYSTLNFVAAHAKKHKNTPIVTFDQPLWWKAHLMVSEEPPESPLSSIVVRLGGFHTEMSFLGSVGFLMAGSGLEQVLETVYASVDHILSGKAISRAVRAHLMIDRVLTGLLLSEILQVPLEMTTVEDNNENSNTKSSIFYSSDATHLQALYIKLLTNECSVDEVISDSVLQELLNKYSSKTESLKSSRTAKLWLQYSEMILILRKFITAERLGDWDLHLSTLAEMLPYLAASGHNLYTKSVVIYLDHMRRLPHTHPDVYQHFMDGKHCVRRSDRLWAGLSTDLVIEQDLMRSIKTSGGLTRGSGMSEFQRNLWVLSRPACAEVNKSMQSLTGIAQSTSEQNKDMSIARQTRDWKDMEKIHCFLKDKNPFMIQKDLVNISNGMHASSTTVNVDDAKERGIEILQNMSGKNPSNHTFKRKDHAVTLASKNSVIIENESVQIDPNLMFQRLASFATKSPDTLEKAFEYELCS